MHILFLTHYFPPEVNAPASRTYENAKHWIKAGHKVTVITCAPNHPNGIVYEGYKNRLWNWDEKDGIKILRIKTYLSANEGFFKRILNYISYMVSATFFSFLVKDVDIIVSTSPQFFCGMAGVFVAGMKRSPWILEIRDLWPESIIAVGAMKNQKIINLLTKMETWMYQKADHIVSVTDSFKHHIINRGVKPELISVIKNGADLQQFSPLPKDNAFSRQYNLTDKFVASYMGTHGMAHGLETLFKTAEILKNNDSIKFLLVGGGAEREKLLQQKKERNLNNVIMLPQQSKEKMPEIIASSDVSLVLLRKADIFKTVIPSKIFEAMALECPIILGVEGESKEIIEAANCGICIEPENARELAEAILRIYESKELSECLGKNGKQFVEKNYSREVLSQKYLDLMIEKRR